MTSGTREQVEELIEQLHHEEALSRHVAAAQLGALRDPRAVEPLLALVEYTEFSDAEGRVAAAKALGEIGDPRAVAPLAEVLRRLTGIVVRVSDGIAKGVGYEAMDAIGAGSAADNAAELARAIARIGGPEAEQVLRSLAEDEGLRLAADPAQPPAQDSDWFRALRERAGALRSVATEALGSAEPAAAPAPVPSGRFRVVVVGSYFAALQAAKLHEVLNPGETALAVIAEAAADGTLSFPGLGRVDGPAVLFLGPQTLEELRADPELGPRIESVESG